MRFAPVLAVVAIVVSGTVANPFGLADIIGFDISNDNHYGAPTPPWNGGKPGWYFGNNPSKYKAYPCLTGIICRILKYFPNALQCPTVPPQPTGTTTSSTGTTTSSTGTTTSSTPSPTPTVPADGYSQTFSNLTAAIQAGDYITFGLVDTVADCKTMCNSVAGCNFANSYHDVNGKDGSTRLTCSLFSVCHDASAATNVGGQTQSDGSVTYITNSDGWCKV
jgi:hypothetical protein